MRPLRVLKSGRKNKPPVRPAREEAGDARDRLTAAAKTLFSRKGFDGTSVKDISDSAGLNVSLISYHFGSKEGLYRSCLENFGQARLAVAQRVLQPPQSVEEFVIRLKMFMDELFNCHLENPEITKILHRECSLDMPITQDVFKKTFLKVHDTLVGFFESAQKSGLLIPNVNAQIVAAHFFGGTIQFAQKDAIAEKFYGLTLKDPKFRAEVIEHIIQYCTQGCIKRSSS
jgi:AcrR family transcriptional regulator